MTLRTLFPLLALSLSAAESFDSYTFLPPPGYSPQRQKSAIVWLKMLQQGRAYCQLSLYTAQPSAPTPAQDVETEWKAAVLPNLRPSAPPATSDWPLPQAPSSQLRRANTIDNNGNKAITSLYVLRFPARYIGAVFNASSPEAASACQQDINATISSIQITATPPPPQAGGKTTNFDDGWVATEQPDWVRATKDNATLLLHYARPDIRRFNNLDEATAFVWNQLVAPRYTGLSNLWIRRSFWSDGDSFHGKYFAQADARDRDGKSVHVVLFKDGTYGKWIEIITPSKADFQSRFTTVQQLDGTNWAPLVKLAVYNKFAVTPADLIGNWASSSGAAVQYYEVYTGNNAGIAYASSSESFAFRPDGTYTSVYKGAQNLQDGRGTQFHGESFTGKFSATNWELTLTNRFKGATHAFTAQFEAVKGGRVLHLYRGNIEELHLFKRP